ncbi:MAG: LysR family transcriptional regulator, partial [Pseudomonadota bacterium]
MDKLNAMSAFVNVVEQQSFTKAAQILNLPRSTLTDAIKQLEFQ